jgi:hypothetical protein
MLSKGLFNAITDLNCLAAIFIARESVEYVTKEPLRLMNHDLSRLM